MIGFFRRKTVSLEEIVEIISSIAVKLPQGESITEVAHKEYSEYISDCSDETKNKFNVEWILLCMVATSDACLSAKLPNEVLSYVVSSAYAKAKTKHSLPGVEEFNKLLRERYSEYYKALYSENIKTFDKFDDTVLKRLFKAPFADERFRCDSLFVSKAGSFVMKTYVTLKVAIYNLINDYKNRGWVSTTLQKYKML